MRDKRAQFYDCMCFAAALPMKSHRHFVHSPRGAGHPDLPLASGLGGSTGITSSHGSRRGGKGRAEGTEGSRLGEGCAEHFWAIGDVWCSGCRRQLRDEKQRLWRDVCG